MSKMIEPPKISEWLMRIFFPDKKEYSTIGDLEEVYQTILETDGKYRANWWYRKQVINSIKPKLSGSIFFGGTMLGNYLKIAFRNIKKNKTFSIINISGLAVGMASCIIILLWIQAELGFDKFHENIDNLYRTYQVQDYSGDQQLITDNLPGVLADELKEKFPEVEKTSRFLMIGKMPVRFESKSFNDAIMFTDSDLFQMFSFPLKYGDQLTLLDDPSSVVITETIAQKYFGNENPLGKTITVNNKYDFKITGVLSDLPTNTHLANMEILLPFSKVPSILGEPFDWGSNWPRTYLQLREGTEHYEFDKKINGVLEDHGYINAKLHVQKISDINLYTLTGEPDLVIYIYIFSGIATIILLIACINFTNLSTAKSNMRSKEVGLRKVIGAKKTNIIYQFFGESILLTLLSLTLAIIITILVIPLANNIVGEVTGSHISFNLIENYSILFMILGVTVLTGILAGIYPSFYLSSFMPVQVLRGTNVSASTKINFRNTLVVVQFVISIVLIVTSFVMQSQLNFMKKNELGYNKDNLVYLPLLGDSKQNYSVLKEKILKDPNIITLTSTSRLPLSGGDSGNPKWEGKPEDMTVLINGVDVDYNYIEAMEMTITEGRSFRPKLPGDKNNRVEVILNEKAVKVMELEEPLGKWFGKPDYGIVVGIVKDFNFASLKSEIAPMAIFSDPQYSKLCLARINPDKAAASIIHIENCWKEVNPNIPFHYEFLDDNLAQLYGFENRVGELLQYFTIIAIIIACLGLFGLASYTAERRTKEVGIRKTLGASVPGIITLISKEFVKHVIIACVIAWPISHYIMIKWLENFAYKINVGIEIFLWSGLIAFLIALLTVGYQAVKASLANPVESLKYE